MDWLFVSMTEAALYDWEQILGEWFFVLSIAFLGFELLRYFLRKKLDWKLAGDTATNFLTFVFSVGIAIAFYYLVLISAYSWFHQFALFDIGINWATVMLCIVLADLAYYWEHRFLHRVAVGWATHTVHHSSPNFNISVAYRFGPMDGIWPMLFHIPLVLAGFNPFVVLFAEIVVQLYQTALHTEVIRKLPRPVEAIMNTPSHHRVHHGSNDEYIDKNYGGIFIIWDRMFGTFAEEESEVVFGIKQPIDSVNPFKVFFHGLSRLWRQLRQTNGAGNRLRILLKPPGWRAEVTDVSPATEQRGGPG